MVLSDKTIKEELAKGRIVIDPLGEGCIQPASVDVHLGSEVLIFRNSKAAYIDIRQDLSGLTEVVEIEEDTGLLHIRLETTGAIIVWNPGMNFRLFVCSEI